MTKTLVLLIALLSFQMAIAQSTDEDKSSPLYYKWKNETFPIDTLVSYYNDTLILSENNKVFVINFWFTTCQPCIAEINWLNKLQADYANDSLAFIGISFNSKQEIDAFVQTKPYDFKQFHMEKEIINEYVLVKGYPTTLILDSTGKVILYKVGAPQDEALAESIYDELAEELRKLGFNNH